MYGSPVFPAWFGTRNALVQIQSSLRKGKSIAGKIASLKYYVFYMVRIKRPTSK